MQDNLYVAMVMAILITQARLWIIYCTEGQQTLFIHLWIFSRYFLTINACEYDMQVTDKTLFQEVADESVNIKDKRVKDDECIYMVLEYGEIDLAHMLSQKWKEINTSGCKIDENWLRFYWQVIHHFP